MSGPIQAVPGCKMCRRPLERTTAHEIKLGSARWYVCPDCFPVVTSVGTAAADVLHDHVIPTAKAAATGFMEHLLEGRPGLRAAFKGAIRGYEQGKADQSGEPRK